ncbi:hypothetical protein HRW08_08510 [Streptomyces lunaelactis]|nr:hypothetical protein [Streptomyces lunaelactis]NUK58734.1 hypothetical protein [Streptomyces lunaelactis]
MLRERFGVSSSTVQNALRVLKQEWGDGGQATSDGGAIVRARSYRSRAVAFVR